MVDLLVGGRRRSPTVIFGGLISGALTPETDAFDVIGLGEKIERCGFDQAVTARRQPFAVSCEGCWITRNVDQGTGRSGQNSVHSVTVQSRPRRIDHDHVRAEIQVWKYVLDRPLVKFDMFEFVQINLKIQACAIVGFDANQA